MKLHKSITHTKGITVRVKGCVDDQILRVLKREILLFMFDPERKKVNGGCRSLCFEEIPLLLPFHKYLCH